MHLSLPLITLLALIATTASAANDIILPSKFKNERVADTQPDTLVLRPTPAMKCDKCAAKIKKQVRFVKGTKKIDVSVPDQTVTIVYDAAKANYSNYVAEFAKLGYKVEEVGK